MRLQSLLPALLVAWLAAAAGAELAPESPGTVETLPQPPHAHWVWVSDLVLERSALIDLDDGRFLGIVNGGYGTVMPLFPARRAEIYVPATYYSRRTHGERADVLEIYDSATLGHLAEVSLPPKRATNAVALAHATLSDDDRFVAVFNWTTGTSLSIVDAERRTFAAEIDTPGCSLVYAAGPRRFLSLCPDGTTFTVSLDDDGHELARQSGAAFFDPRADPVTEKAVRCGSQWLFVSFSGNVHPVDVSGPNVQAGEPWPLFDDADRAQSWRVGGLQHVAVHVASRRLYVLVHRGGADTHKDPGEEVWIYDIDSHRRVERVQLVNPGVVVMGFPLQFGENWFWPFNRLSDRLLDTFAPALITAIQVTQDDEPLLVTASQFSGAVAVHDGRTGKFLRRVQPVGWTTDVVLAPWGARGQR